MEISRNQQGWPTAFTSCISVLQVLTLLFDLLSCTILGDPGAVRNLFRPCLITFVATTVSGFPKMDRLQQSLWFSPQNIPLKTTIPAFLIGLEQWCYCRADLNSKIIIFELSGDTNTEKKKVHFVNKVKLKQKQ